MPLTVNLSGGNFLQTCSSSPAITFLPKMFLFLILLSWLLLASQSSSQSLSATYLSTTLPSPLSYPMAHYDGADSIYIFSDGRNSPILKFSLSSETLTSVGTVPVDIRGGSVTSDAFGNIFIFGFHDGIYSTYAYKFNPDTAILTPLATLGRGMSEHINFHYNSTSPTVFLVGGNMREEEVYGFNMETEVWITVSRDFLWHVKQGAGVRFGNQKAYIFDNTQDNHRRALELDLDSFEAVAVGPASLPLFSLWPEAVTDGRNAYIVGGYTPNWEGTNGLIQFDPSTYENVFLPVSNWPVEGVRFFRVAPATVYVPGRDRIYFFGGMSYNATGNWYRSHDEIFFVDLAPLRDSQLGEDSGSLDEFSCKERTDGKINV